MIEKSFYQLSWAHQDQAKALYPDDAGRGDGYMYMIYHDNVVGRRKLSSRQQEFLFNYANTQTRAGA